MIPSFTYRCVCVYYCRTYYKAVRVGEEDCGGHVLTGKSDAEPRDSQGEEDKALNEDRGLVGVLSLGAPRSKYWEPGP